jgi:ubiquinone/menaquinone biosynthesis C-methylase UbiE
VVPHLRKMHPDVWARYVQTFREMHADGESYRDIMWAFGRAFTWLVVARELADSDGRLTVVDPATVQPRPKSFEPSTTTRWSFPQRGKWGVHDAKYRGNWAPEVPRNLILRYSKKKDVVLDPFVGGGTTVLEAMELGRKAVGIDISPRAVRVTSHKAQILADALRAHRRAVPDYQVHLGDARRLPIEDETVDLVCAHPPYLDIIHYTKSNPADLSTIYDPVRFTTEMRRIVAELFRVLRVNGVCGVLVGDVRRNGKLIPLGFLTMRAFLGAFDLREIVIKDQHQSAMSHFWSNRERHFLSIAHEYLFIFAKPRSQQAAPSFMSAM